MPDCDGGGCGRAARCARDRAAGRSLRGGLREWRRICRRKDRESATRDRRNRAGRREPTQRFAKRQARKRARGPRERRRTEVEVGRWAVGWRVRRGGSHGRGFGMIAAGRELRFQLGFQFGSPGFIAEGGDGFGAHAGDGLQQKLGEIGEGHGFALARCAFARRGERPGRARGSRRWPVVRSGGERVELEFGGALRDAKQFVLPAGMKAAEGGMQFGAVQAALAPVGKSEEAARRQVFDARQAVRVGVAVGPVRCPVRSPLVEGSASVAAAVATDPSTEEGGGSSWTKRNQGKGAGEWFLYGSHRRCYQNSTITSIRLFTFRLFRKKGEPFRTAVRLFELRFVRMIKRCVAPSARRAALADAARPGLHAISRCFPSASPAQHAPLDHPCALRQGPCRSQGWFRAGLRGCRPCGCGGGIIPGEAPDGSRGMTTRVAKASAHQPDDGTAANGCARNDNVRPGAEPPLTYHVFPRCTTPTRAIIVACRRPRATLRMTTRVAWASADRPATVAAARGCVREGDLRAEKEPPKTYEGFLAAPPQYTQACWSGASRSRGAREDFVNAAKLLRLCYREKRILWVAFSRRMTFAARGCARNDNVTAKAAQGIVSDPWEGGPGVESPHARRFSRELTCGGIRHVEKFGGGAFNAGGRAGSLVRGMRPGE